MDRYHLRRLWAVFSVVETGSALKASAKIHLSQPTITHAIAMCESELSVRLFERTSRGMSPTPAGEAFGQRLRVAAGYLKLAETTIHARAPIHRQAAESQLRALSTIIDTGSSSEAARRLGLSQPAIHRAARDLETLCGVLLFRREGAQMVPTPEARILARHSDLCFNEIDMGLDELREMQGFIEGNIRVGALPLARSQWLPKAVAATLEQFPDARFRIMDGPYEEQQAALRHGRIDFILGALRPDPPKDLHQETVFRDPVLILVRGDHPLAADFDSETDKLTPAQLSALSWILPPIGTPGRGNFEAFMASKNLTPPRRVVECSSLVATREMLLRSHHAAILSSQQVEVEVASGLLKVMGPPLTGSARDIGITLRRDFRPTRLHEAFLGHLTSVP